MKRAAVLFKLLSPPTLVVACIVCQSAVAAERLQADGETIIGQIARSIELVKPEYPQLAKFSYDLHYDPETLTIQYGNNTHRSQHQGGWSAGVPNPDEDGIWFYIDLHDPDSTRQIHTQPIVARYRYHDMEVMFLILQGETTTEIRMAIDEIFASFGVERVKFCGLPITRQCKDTMNDRGQR